MQLTLA
ncbi:hypothetical protein N499_1177A, partial [Wolbachia pipientis wVitA]